MGKVDEGVTSVARFVDRHCTMPYFRSDEGVWGKLAQEYSLA